MSGREENVQNVTSRRTGSIGGGKTWGGVKIKNSLSHHEISPQDSFVELHAKRLIRCKDLTKTNAIRALLVYPVFDDKKSNGLDEKSVKRITAFKRTLDYYNCYKFRLRAINKKKSDPRMRFPQKSYLTLPINDLLGKCQTAEKSWTTFTTVIFSSIQLICVSIVKIFVSWLEDCLKNVKKVFQDAEISSYIHTLLAGSCFQKKKSSQ